MKISRSFLFAVIAFAALILQAWADDEKKDEAPAVDPQAVAILKRAVDRLADAKQFSVTTEIWEDTELEEGGRAQFTRIADMKVRRPDRARVDVRTSVPKRSFFYDGKSLSLLDYLKGFYGTISAPGTIDAMLDKVEQDYDVSFPLDDILVSRPFGDGAAKAKGAQYLGVEPVLGVVCHHLAFQSETIDWQAWVEDGPVAVVRKAVITSKEDEGSPQLIALFSHWDFTTELPDFVFTFDPPPGTLKIEFVPAPKEDAEAKPAPK